MESREEIWRKGLRKGGRKGWDEGWEGRGGRKVNERKKGRKEREGGGMDVQISRNP